MFRTRFLSLIPVGMVALLVSSVTVAAVHTYSEDFSSRQFCDTLKTSAWWDSTAGEIKLHPFTPSLQGGVATPGYTKAVAIAGDYAYVADQSANLLIMDISDPEVPIWVTNVNTSGQAWDVVVAGNYAYVATNARILQVVDISDPLSPITVATPNMTSNVSGVAVAGDYAYVVGYGLNVVDISDPTAPVLVAFEGSTVNAGGVAVAGNYAYLADWYHGMRIIDISNPLIPTYVTNIGTPGISRRIAVDGNHAFIGDRSGGLHIFDISVPTSPTSAGSIILPGDPHGVAVTGDYVYVASGAEGLQIVDINDPTNPSVFSSCDTPGASHGLAVSGNYAFVADEPGGFQVVKFADPAPPVIVGSYDTAGQPHRVTVAGNHAFVADHTNGLVVLDITDPENPAFAGGDDTPGTAFDVTVVGDHAYVADYDAGLQVIDISNPAMPTAVGVYDTPAEARGVAVAGDLAFVADGTSGLQIIDVSVSALPTLVSSYATSHYAISVAVAGDYVFIADADSGLQVVDISDPAVPSLAGTYQTTGIAMYVAVAGDHAYVAARTAGLLVLDISDPTTPFLVGTCDTPDQAHGVSVSGDRAFVADRSTGLFVVDIEDPTDPVPAGVCDTPGLALGVTWAGDQVFVADETFGLQVIAIRQYQLDTARNLVQSRTVASFATPLRRARLTTIQSDTVTWELSADGGLNWDFATTDDTWLSFTVPGTDLRWRSHHCCQATRPLINPTCSLLTISWLEDAPAIASIVDIPADQGGQVRLQFVRSRYDEDGEIDPITNYAVWRRLDEPRLLSELASLELAAAEKGGGLPLIEWRNRRFHLNHGGQRDAEFPPGIWEILVTVPAVQQDEYIAPLATLADSSSAGIPYATFCVTAHTAIPATWYCSLPDSGYSLDNLAPALPAGFAVMYGPDNQLEWLPSPEEDFQYYRIYRGSDAGFVPDPENLVHATVDTEWTDTGGGFGSYYKITATDVAGNESDPASAGTITGISPGENPHRTALYQNKPNPFNPSTRIQFTLPVEILVELVIYDVMGRRVTTLVRETLPAGRHDIDWDGCDGSGRTVPSGLYFYRFQSGRYQETRSMVLIR